MINEWFSGCFRATICLCVLALFAVALAGCGTLAETSDEVGIRHSLINKTRMKQMQDDVDGIFLMKEPSRLTDMYVR